MVNTCFASCATNTNCTTGTNSPALSNDWLTLQPSLATDAVRLIFSTPVVGKANIQVFDAAGKTVLAEIRNDLTDSYLMPVAGLKNGLYFLLVQTAERAASGRFVKQD